MYVVIWFAIEKERKSRKADDCRSDEIESMVEGLALTRPARISFALQY